jgi:hypothetical protein
MKPAISSSIRAIRLLPFGFSRRYSSCSFVNASVVKHSLSMFQSVSRSSVVACLTWMDSESPTIQVKLLQVEKFESFGHSCQLSFVAKFENDKSRTEFLCIRLSDLPFNIFLAKVQEVTLAVPSAV